jgi:phosphoglycerol transferase
VTSNKQKLSSYYFGALAIFLPPLIFILLFQIWKVDLSQLIFNYNTDVLLMAFGIKNIIATGWYFSNDMVGLPHIDGKIFYLHDFPAHADFLNFVIIKIFTYFSSDPFFILNSFFILTLSLVSLSSFAVLRHFKISNFTALIISILFAFTPYHLFRNVIHLFLSNYAIIPPVIMVSLWIACDKIQIFKENAQGQFCFTPNKFFLVAAVISCLASGSGIYYALYSCVIFSFAWFLSSIHKGKFLNQSFCAVIFLALITFSILLLLNMPSILYWFHNGGNPAVAGRSVEQSYRYGLKIISLFVPVANHYIGYLSNLHDAFGSLTVEIETPSESLGILASMGLVLLLIWPFARSLSDNKNSFFQNTVRKLSLKKDEQNLISQISSLNLLIILFATVGGLVMFVAMPFPLLRSHARFSIFIAFLALFLIAIIFDKIIVTKNLNKSLAKILILIISVFALLDQTGRTSANVIQTEKMKNQFNDNRQFVEKIEKEMPANSAIFQLPILTFPEGGDYSLVLGYLHSNNLRWSYPAVKGRESANWQEKVFGMNFEDFISEIKKAGFSGVYLDRTSFIVPEKDFDDLSKQLKKLRELENNLKLVSKKPPLISKNSRLIFFEI